MSFSTLPLPARVRHTIALLLIGSLATFMTGCGAIGISRPGDDATAQPAATPVAPTSLPKPTPAEPTGPIEPSPADEPTPSLDPPPAAGPFEMDLYRKGDFVSQATKDYCTAAAMQIMVNIVEDGKGDTSRKRQDALYDLGRSLPPFDRGPGIPPQAWAAALDEWGVGPYIVHTEPTRIKALNAAALAMRMTGRPVGLVMWRGAHAWVMSGFEATADPAFTDDFAITGVWTEDPWYPRVSSIWGRSNKAHTLVTPTKIGEDFLQWKRPTGDYPEYDKTFVLILPVLEAPEA